MQKFECTFKFGTIYCLFTIPFIVPNLIVNFDFPNQILFKLNWHRNVPYPQAVRSSLSPIVKNLPTGTVCLVGSLPIGKFAKWATIISQDIIGTAKDASSGDYKTVCSIYKCSVCMGKSFASLSSSPSDSPSPSSASLSSKSNTKVDVKMPEAIFYCNICSSQNMQNH